ncbi:MAG: type I-E CRISPR-associated protein Cse2/CasB [Halothiobacillaceae bacterium]|nr:type I-E CRISPR-associated protein Cse2/CasB [Halothiobacillaceae bacterium]
MSGFFAWLEKLNESDSKVRAVLRRSLAFNPGQHIPVFPYVEPFLKGEESGWRREMHYLVAGLWAAHWCEGRTGAAHTLAHACAVHQLHSGSASTERRFISLLDADREQLPHRLRQMVALLGEQPIDFETLLDDLLRWNSESKRTQNAWARDFYRALAPVSQTQPDTVTETAE